jgi:hypothetical protein
MEKIDPDGATRLRYSFSGNNDIIVLTPKRYASDESRFQSVFNNKKPKSLSYLESDILQLAYENIQLKAFPAKLYGEPLFDWRHDLMHGHPYADRAIVIAGHNLRGQGTPVVTGMVEGAYLKPSKTSYLEYIAVDENCRTGGIGFQLNKTFDYVMQRLAKANGVEKTAGDFLDCQNPAVPIPAGDNAFPPAQRIDIYKKWDWDVMSGDYRLPLAARPGGWMDTLVLMARKQQGAVPSKDVVGAFLLDMCHMEGVVDPESSPTYQGMIKSFGVEPQRRDNAFRPPQQYVRSGQGRR